MGAQVARLARNPGHNFYFHGDTIYSYGSHFPIARHVENNRGQAVLFTTRGYSATTAGHKCMVEGACRHLTVFHVPDVNSTEHRKQFADYSALCGACPPVCQGARAETVHSGRIARPGARGQRLRRIRRFAGGLSLPDDMGGMIAECRAIEKKEREREQRQEAKRRREAQERLQKWVDGETDYCPSGYPSRNGEPIRLRIKGEELQTSLAARVPLAHAVKAFRVIKRLHDKGQAYQRNGHTIHLGHFALDAIDTQGNVTAGCHHVSWEEIERVAILAGVN